MQDLLKKLLMVPEEQELAFDSVQDKVISAPSKPNDKADPSEATLDPLGAYLKSRKDEQQQQRDLALFRDRDSLRNSQFGSMANLDNMFKSLPKKQEPSQPTAVPAVELEEPIKIKSSFSAEEITPLEKPTTPELTSIAPQSSTTDMDKALEYVRAAKNSTEQKRRVAMLEAMNSVTEGMVGQGGIGVKTGAKFDKLYDLADAELQELEVRDKGVATQNKLTRDSIAMRLESEAADPNSAMSDQARNAYASTLMKLGREDLANKINDSKLSFAQLKSAYGSYNLANMEAIYESAQNRLAQSQMRMAASAEQAAAKEQDKIEKRTAELRREMGSNRFGKLASQYDLTKRVTSSIDDFMKRPSGYSDFGTLMTGVKALQGDDSVVREAELRQAQQATSAINKAKNIVDSWTTGKTLQPEQRKQIYDAVKIMQKAGKAAYVRGIAPVLNQAIRNNIPLEELIDADLAAEIKKDPTMLLSYEEAKKAKQDSKVKVRTPQGKVVLVPYAKVNEAVSAGGVIIDE